MSAQNLPFGRQLNGKVLRQPIFAARKLAEVVCTRIIIGADM
jgi:hypothetical protein